MKIAVCIKQVPGTTQVEVDPVTGTLKRDGVESKLNPYDLYALETALRLKEQLGAEVTALSMGPPQAEEILREAYMMGVDDAVLVSDRARHQLRDQSGAAGGRSVRPHHLRPPDH